MHTHFGSVFYGKIPDGKNIAVKVFSLFSKQGIHEFQNKVGIISQIEHVIISLSV